jgi:hypothetical protein
MSTTLLLTTQSDEEYAAIRETRLARSRGVVGPSVRTPRGTFAAGERRDLMAVIR